MKPMTFLLSIFAVLGIPAIAMADVISIRSDEWCPYVCDNKESPGYMVEVVTKIFAKQGHQVDFSLVNWARAVQEVRHNRSQAVLGALHNDAPDFIFPTKPLAAGQNHFYVRKDSPWVYTGVESLKGKRIGIINSYAYGAKIDEIIKSQKKNFVSISGEYPLVQILKMMNSERLDAFIENESVLRYHLSISHIPMDTYKAVSVSLANNSNLYIAFSPKNPKSMEYSKAITKGLSELRQSGELRKILAKYHLPDWDDQSIILTRSKNLRPGRLKGSLDPLYVVDTGSL
ncbi:MAG: substrate-binding periplasmic protein [Bdellovibrio sp.]